MFVKTVFSAFETFDSAPVERMRGPCHLFVKRCLQLVRMCPEEAGFSQYLCFSPQSHQTSMSATEWFIRKLGIKESGPLKFYRLPSSGLTGDVAFLTSWG